MHGHLDSEGTRCSQQGHSLGRFGDRSKMKHWRAIKDLLSSQFQQQNICTTKPSIDKSHYSYTAAKNSVQVCIYICLILQNLKIRKLAQKKKKNSNRNLICFSLWRTAAFQGKFLGIKLPNVSSISLVFTIYKFTEKLNK